MSNNTSQNSSTNSSNQSGSRGRGPVEAKSSMFNIATNRRRPNVFTTDPRPGGYAFTEMTEKVAQQVDLNNALGIIYTPPSPTSRQKLIKGFQNLDNWVASKGDSKNPCDPDSSKSSFDAHDSPREPFLSDESWTGLLTSPQDLNYVMAIAISCAMGLAANPTVKPPKHHLTWTYHFINSIKDDDNRTPMNLAGLRSMIDPFVGDLDLPKPEALRTPPSPTPTPTPSPPPPSPDPFSPSRDDRPAMNPQLPGQSPPRNQPSPPKSQPPPGAVRSPTPSVSNQSSLRTKGAVPKSGAKKSNWK